MTAPDQPALGAAVKAIRKEKKISQVAVCDATDTLVFDENERGPDEDLRLQFEATTRLSDDEKHVVKAVIESILLSHGPNAGRRRGGAQQAQS